MEASNNKHNEDKPQFLNEYEPESKRSDRIVRFAIHSLSLYPWRKGSGFGR